MRTLKFQLLFLPILFISLFSSELFALEFHGYVRSGIGVSDNGSQQCGNVHFIGRLGNECETYAELRLDEELFRKDDLTFRFFTGVSYLTRQRSDYEVFGDENEIALRKAYVEAQGLFKFDPEAILWTGKRFYDRHDIHHLDFFYWNITGPGAGVENISVGGGKLGFAVLRRDDDDINANIYDLRFSRLKLGDHELELGLNIFQPNPDETQEQNGFSDERSLMLSFLLRSPLNQGTNDLAIQYATDGYAKTLRFSGGGANIRDLEFNNKGYRILNSGVYTPREDFHLAYALWYAYSDDEANSDDISMWSISARPSFIFDENNRTYLELGMYKANDAGVKSEQKKLTLAYAWTVGTSYWDRPELRAFISYMHDAENDENFRGKDRVINIGLQAEAWW